MWWSWYGGSFWGPRFLLFLCPPASLILAIFVSEGLAAGRRQDKVLVSLALLLSGWVGINGSLYGLANVDVCCQNNYAQEFLCWYTPEFSVLWRPFVVGFEPGVPGHLPFALWQIAVLVYLLACLLWKPKMVPVSSD